VLLCLPLTALAQDDKAAQAERKLAAVRAEIQAIGRELGALAGERDAAARALRDADRAVAAAAHTLRDTDAALAAQQQRLAALEAERAAAAERLTEQRAALAALLRSAHAMGSHQRLKLLLAQDRLEQAARALGYHRFLQEAQVGRIEGLLAQLSELARLGERIAAERRALDDARAGQQQALAALGEQRAERARVLDALDLRRADRSTRLAALERDQRALVALLERLRDVFADIPPELEGAQPLAERKGALPRPLAGKVLAGFGDSLPDGRSSRGWLLSAAPGAEVRAIGHGRVAFADWLRGFGLIAIVDHGQGWMSLYAQNEALLVAPGAWVRAGEVLATVGSSGGQADNALYFELRRDGKPVDPASWLER
jgi:septal ring factor EnvC (AmiA/AmiB activator)